MTFILVSKTVNITSNGLKEFKKEVQIKNDQFWSFIQVEGKNKTRINGIYYQNKTVDMEINEDRLFILVSDGLSDNDVPVKHWETHLLPLLTSSANLDIGVQSLIDLGNQYNGHDNITAVLVRAKVRLVGRNQY